MGEGEKRIIEVKGHLAVKNNMQMNDQLINHGILNVLLYYFQGAYFSTKEWEDNIYHIFILNAKKIKFMHILNSVKDS